MKEKLGDIAREITASYGRQVTDHFRGMPLPSREEILRALDIFFEIIYPGYHSRSPMALETALYRVGGLLDTAYDLLREQIYRAVIHECRQDHEECAHCRGYAGETAYLLLGRIPWLREQLAHDVAATYEGDPAAKNRHEIIFSYPGIEAITVYRIAHELYRLGVPLIPRILSEHSHSHTGIDIHPGAEIGERFFIDHGTGLVIGETTEIGDRVRLYQGVTLGALSVPKGEEERPWRGRKRHPTIEEDVVVYSGATILGGETRVGRGSVIGGNVWLTHSVPPYTKVILEPHAQRMVSRDNGLAAGREE